MILLFPIIVLVMMLVFLYYMILAMTFFIGVCGIGIFYLGKGILISYGKVKESNEDIPFSARIFALTVYLKKKAQIVTDYFDKKPIDKRESGAR